jgi:NitT/TauT family transport system ATP-binding protein
VPDPLLIADGVTLTYPSGRDVVTATYRVDFEIFAGDSYILLGPSGCGKSSLLKAVGGYLPATEGRISLNGREIRAPGPDRMMVFQEFDQLLPWRTVKQNVMFPMRATRKWSRAEAGERADAFLSMVGLAKFRDAYPHTLSGGMKQRAAIARGMAMEPAILLMDEPFAALDSMTRAGMQDELLRLREQTGCTLLFVTHSIAEAIKIGSRILLLSAHPGRVRAEINNVQPRLREPDGAKRLEAQIYELLFRAQPEAAAA